MSAKLRVERTAAGVVRERDLDDNEGSAAGGTGPIVFDVLPRDASIGRGIHRAHRTLHKPIAKDVTAYFQGRRQGRMLRAHTSIAHPLLPRFRGACSAMQRSAVRPC